MGHQRPFCTRLIMSRSIPALLLLSLAPGLLLMLTHLYRVSLPPTHPLCRPGRLGAELQLCCPSSNSSPLRPPTPPTQASATLDIPSQLYPDRVIESNSLVGTYLPLPKWLTGPAPGTEAKDIKLVSLCKGHDPMCIVGP